MSFDPYAALGVAREATPAALRIAYLEAVKRTHPDAGGSREDFEVIQRAWKILSNDELRAHFDKTGHIADPKPDNDEAIAWQLIDKTLSMVLLADQDHLDADLVAEIKKSIYAGIEALEKNIACLARALKRAGRMKGRFRRRLGDDEVDMFNRMLGWHERVATESIAGSREKLRWQRRALAIISEYEYQREALPGALGRIGHRSIF